MLAAWCGYGWGPGPWFLFFPLFWIAVIFLLVFVFRRRPWGHWHGGSGAAVLSERFARGEISEEEYEKRLSVLRKGGR